MKMDCATTDEEILACFPLFRVLRPHLVETEFVASVRRQQAQGYQLIRAVKEGKVMAAAGYRIQEFLAWGKVLYVDDLIAHPDHRGSGFGGALVDWLIAWGQTQGCAELHLDSGYQRSDAHRLYLNKGMQLSSHHFSMKLTGVRT